MEKCHLAEKQASCAAVPQCAWDAHSQECFAKQGALLAALLGESSRAAMSARICNAIKSEAGCERAGTVEYDHQKATKGLFPLPAPAVKRDD